VKTSFPEREDEWRQIGGARRRIWNDSMVFKYKSDGWQEAKLDEGHNFYDPFTGELTGVQTDNLKMKVGTTLLDGAGGELPSGGTPVPLYFNVYYFLDFSIFGLDGVF
jgi:hypothetical protein